MAYINDMYVFVESESVSRTVDTSSHPVESGLELTDNVSRKNIELSISGEIVGEDSYKIQTELKRIMNAGELVVYSGRNIMSNYLITKFSTDHPNTIWGGCSFSMSLVEVRVANSSYTENQSKNESDTYTVDIGCNQVQVNKNTSGVRHIVKTGDTWLTLCGNADSPYHKYGMSYNDFVKINSSGGVYSEVDKNGAKHFYLKKNCSVIVGYEQADEFQAALNYQAVKHKENEASKDDTLKAMQEIVKRCVEVTW